MKTVLLKFMIFFPLCAQTSTQYAKLLFNGNCVTCHEIGRSLSAPSINSVQSRYKAIFPAKREFVSYMTRWVANPDARTAVMEKAVKRYGVMPQLGYDKDTLRQIAAYIYEAEFSQNNRKMVQ